MKIICNSAFSAIKSKKSSDVFVSILKDMWLKDYTQLLLIYNKVKTLIPISLDESNLIIDVIRSESFKESYIKIKSDFYIENKNKLSFNYSNLILTFFTFITSSRVIEILENSDEEIIFEGDKKYIKIDNNNKSHYLEIIEKSKEYSIWTDLRSWKYKVVDNVDYKILLETKEEISFDHTKSCEIGLFLEWELDYNYFCCYNLSLPFPKDSKVYKSRYSTFIINQKLSIIYQVDNKTSRVSIKNIHWNILNIKNGYLLYFISPIWYKWDFTPWIMNFFSIEKNIDLVQNIHTKYYEFIWNKFISMSYDLKYIYIFNLDIKNLNEVYIDDLSSINKLLTGDKLWLEVKKYAKKY